MWPELVLQVTLAVEVSLPQASLWAGSQPSPVLLLTLQLFFFLRSIPVLGIKEKTGCVCTGFGLLRVLLFSSQCHLSFLVLLYMDSSTAGLVFYAMWQKECFFPLPSPSACDFFCTSVYPCYYFPDKADCSALVFGSCFLPKPILDTFIAKQLSQNIFLWSFCQTKNRHWKEVSETFLS